MADPQNFITDIKVVITFTFFRISQAIFQAENVLEPAVLRQMFKLRRKVTI